MNSQTFGEQIRRLRQDNNMSLRQLANKIDFDQSTLSKVERNEAILPSRFIKPLSDHLSVNYKELQIKYLSERLYYDLKNQDYALESLTITMKRLEKERSGTNIKMKREKLINKITGYLSHYPIEKAWLFGSFARKEESYDSDIDILLRFEKPNEMDLFDYVGLNQELEELVGRQVDLVEEGYVLDNVQDQIEKEKVLIYER
jgi:predicted nucleotidyltransferase/DNA-binding XRE family transcriptional regulator